MRRQVAAAVVAGLTVSAGVAFAGNGGGEKHAFTAADQAAARATVIRRADLGAGTWHGGFIKPDLSAPQTCPTYNPKQSDLVLTGAAAAEFSANGVDFNSEADILKTAQMVQLDWQRSVNTPALLPCLRTRLAQTPPAGGTLVSVERLALPKLAAQAFGIRVLVDIVSGGQTVRVMVDEIAIVHRRTELSLTTSAPYAAHTPVLAAEVRLARLLVKRATV
jgi:hypothetical protein